VGVVLTYYSGREIPGPSTERAFVAAPPKALSLSVDAALVKIAVGMM
jgi:hypothetical protein